MLKQLLLSASLFLTPAAALAQATAQPTNWVYAIGPTGFLVIRLLANADLSGITSIPTLTTVGALVGGSIGAGFTINLGAATLVGALPCANLPALTGNVTSSGCATTIAAGAVTAAMIASAAKAVASDVQAGTSSSLLVTPAALSGAQAIQTLTDAATIAWNMATGYNAVVTIGASRTLGAPTNFFVGQTYTLQVIQGGAGSFTMSWPGSFDWGAAGAPVLTTAAGKNDLIQLLCISATPTFLATAAKGF